MSERAEDTPPEAGKLPTGRLGRTARVGGLVTGQGLRWAGMRTANRLRTPERAEAAQQERTAALVNELVEQLGRMRGAAMKVGQMISMVEFDGLPEDQRQELQAKLASLRDNVPPVPFPKLERMMREELGGPLSQAFSEFDEQAFAAASIGQVHRAVTVAGDEVAVKVQYPGVAEAVETDMRNAMLLVPLVKRLAPGIDSKALFSELRERISEELDYELEAQHQRRVERLLRGHPFIFVPRVDTALSTRRILVSEFIHGERFEAVRERDEAERDRYGEIVHDKDALALKSALITGGYLPADRADIVDPDLALRMMRRATRWYAVPGHRRFGPDDDLQRRRRRREHPESDDEQSRANAREQINQFTLPPETVLIRRMHGIVGIVLWQLRAGADWGAIAAEYLHGAPPATALGEAETAFFG